MRLAVTNPAVQTVEPGNKVSWSLEVVNDGAVIEGITCSIPQLDPSLVTVSPVELPLFPGETGRLAVSVQLPLTFPAGRHQLHVEARSSVTLSVASAITSIEVSPRADARLRVFPAAVRARRRADYTVTYANTGNQPIAVQLSAADGDRAMRYEFGAGPLSVAPGETVDAPVTVRARRVLFGSDRGRPFTVRADGAGLELEAPGEFRQRPVLARGLLTVAVLVLIVGLWASAFLVGLHAAYSSDTLTKTAPASFFLTNAQRNGLAAADLNAGPVPKSGPLAPGVGGTISGTVRAFDTGLPVGRIVVSAWRGTPAGERLVSSAASQSDGTYAIEGLFPGSYQLQFHATGFREVWFPTSHSESGAKPVTADAGAVSKNIDVSIKGLPGSISGKVDPGDTLTAVPVTVTARSLLALHGGESVTVSATRGSDGTYSYRIPALPTPDTYQISVSATGYAPSLTSDDVEGGQDRSESTILLSSATSAITGTVTSGGKPIGGVTVSTSINGSVVSTGTPTTGNGVGSFTLDNLPTPGTYVLTFALTGFSADPLPETLEPGQAPKSVTVALRPNTNSVSGRVLDGTGAGIGNVTVSVGGAAQPLTTMTLTQATTGHPAGSFTLSGLPSSGSFTVTFSAAGYAAQTAPLILTAGHDPDPITVTLHPSTGVVFGQILGPDGNPSVGATVTVTDGSTVHTTTTTDNPTDPGQAGAWSISGLAPGTYTVTATNTGLGQQSAVVSVTAGGNVQQSLKIPTAS